MRLISLPIVLEGFRDLGSRFRPPISEIGGSATLLPEVEKSVYPGGHDEEEIDFHRFEEARRISVRPIRLCGTEG